MLAKLSAFVVWALVAAGLVFWGYRLWASTVPAPANLQTVAESAGARGDLTRLLGAAPVAAQPPPPVAVESARFRLLGVLAPLPASGPAGPSAAGVALIAVDGRPARAYAVGSRLDGELVLLSISRRSASIGPAQGAASVVLELPPPPVPTTGTLPTAVADGDAQRAPPPGTAPVLRPLPLPQTAAPPEPAAEPDDNEEAVTPQPRPRYGSNPVNR